MSATVTIRKTRPIDRLGLSPSERTVGRSGMDATVFHTQLGWMAVASAADLLTGVVFGYPSEERALGALAKYVGKPLQSTSSPPWLRGVVKLLSEYAEGTSVDFSGVPVSLDHLTEFGRRVVDSCRSIPRGEVRSYGALAEICGAPGAARAVGSVMAKNRYPLIVPCHRVVGAAGSLGGYSAPEGLIMKRRLLAMEGAHETCRPTQSA